MGRKAQDLAAGGTGTAVQASRIHSEMAKRRDQDGGSRKVSEEDWPSSHVYAR